MRTVHPRLIELHDLSVGRLPTHESIRLQRHIFECEPCLYKLIQVEAANELAEQANSHTPKTDPRKPLNIVHATGDGLIYSRAERRGRKWIARHWGEQLNGGDDFRTMREANEFLQKSFREMFPEHRCTEGCKVDSL